MNPTRPGAAPAAQTEVLAAEIAAEQQHVDRVYAELAKAADRAEMVEAEGLDRGRGERLLDAQDETSAALFQRDALVHHAAARRQALQTQHEGLVFGRLDLELPDRAGMPVRSVRYIGRLGVRDEEYEPLVIDWRAPAAGPFYRATPVEPLGVLRRRVLRSSDQTVVGIEDDLMVPEAPDDLVVVGDGALMAALTRSRGPRMRDIVATIQAHQDEAIRAPSRGVTEITGGPGTGKTVVALHRAAYLLYSDRRRFEADGVLVVGPSAAYTAYIERVLPSLGEDSVVMRSLGDLVDAVSTERLDSPEVAAIKGSLRMRRVLARVARDLAPGAPEEFRAFVAGRAIRLDRAVLDRIRSTATRSTQRNLATAAIKSALAEAAWRFAPGGEKDDFIQVWDDHLEVASFLSAWWPQVDPREALLWLADRSRAHRYASGLLSVAEADLLSESMELALRLGTWSVADVALIDDLTSRMAPVQQDDTDEREFYEIHDYDDLGAWGVSEIGTGSARAGREAGPHVRSLDPRDRLLAGTIGRRPEYAHILVDEAQDLSPMQWRMLGRRGRYASWTVVGDAAQSSWPDAAESTVARDEAFAGLERRGFHMTTNYRNAREIFGYAAELIRRHVPDADIPEAVRETGIEPVVEAIPADDDPARAARVVAEHVDRLAGEVDGSVAIIVPARHRSAVESLDGAHGGRVVVTDPMSTKGLEYDATIIVDPDAIVAESPGGVRVLYVALTRAAHRMVVLTVG